jgi:hypothetical protein
MCVCDSHPSDHTCTAVLHVSIGTPSAQQPQLLTTHSVYMGLDTAPNASELIGAVNGVTIAGGLIGALLQSEQSDRLGRRKSVALSCFVAVLGGGLQTGSVHIAMFIVARLIAGLGVGENFHAFFNPHRTDNCRRPLWLNSPVPKRDLPAKIPRPDRRVSRDLHLAGHHDVQVSQPPELPNSSLTHNSWIGYGFYYVDAGGAQWRVPIAIQCVPTLILGIGVFFIPESPRWRKLLPGNNT